MKLSLSHTGKGIRIGALLAALLVIAGCGDIRPYSPPNHREEGPAKGLFTGSQGEWVIVGPKANQAGGAADENTASDSEAERKEKKNPDEFVDGTQQ